MERSPVARRRLGKELAVIEQLGYVDYFLAAARITDWAHRQGIPAVGRGSGVASLVAYLLDITSVDPIRYGLYFERFLHPLRRDCPDLDIDIAWDRRDEVITHVLEVFGENRAAMIGTHQFFRPRGAFAAAARSLGLDNERIQHARRGLPGWSLGGPPRGPSAPAAGNDEGLQRLQRLQRDADPAIRRAAHMALGLCGLPRGIGIHAGGIVLSDGPLSRVVPLERSANGMTITQFDMRGVKLVGLVKIDLLGNRALATLGEASQAAAGGVGIDLEHIDHDDARTAALLSRGQTLGCFQIESPAMRSLLRQLRVCDLSGVTVALALVRPGPSSSGMKSAYAKRVGGAPIPPPIHPLITGILKLTYGVPLYDEDVMRLIAAVTGVSHAEADRLRRAIRAAAQTGAGDAGEGLSALQQGFLAALLNHHHGMYPVRVYVDEARRMGLQLRPPCIHRSQRGWRWEARTHPGLLRCGLTQVRGLRDAIVARILAGRHSRPFRDLADFASRVRPNTAELEALLLSGAFDKAFGQVRGELIWRMRKWLRIGHRQGSPFGRDAPHQGRLALAVPPVAKRSLSGMGAPGTGKISNGPWRDISTEQRARLERRILGMSLAMHPVQLLPVPAGPKALTPITSLSPGPEMVVLQGIVSAVRRYTRDDGVALLFFTLEDDTGLLECIALGSRALRDIGSLEVHHFVRVEGVLHDALGARSLRVERVRALGSH
ncbi:MAG: DNA polymerase III subunit alpha [Candidatus Eisenbacteria sp.]|nr:DNA polymerase III subunit alpha [Candidatus Eisenbacteria bacterium]